MNTTMTNAAAAAAVAPASGATSNTELSALRPRTVWDVVDDAMDAYRRRPALFAAIAAFLLVPYEVLDTALEFSLFGPKGASEGEGSTQLLYHLISLPLFTLATTLLTGATALALRDVLAGRPTSAGRAYGQLLPRLLPLLGAAALYALILVVGAACTLGIVTVIFLVRWAFIAQAVALDGRGVRKAGERSRDLIGPSGGSRVFGLLALLFLMTAILQAGLSGIVELAIMLVPWLQGGDAAARELQQFVLESVLNSLGTVLLAPLAALALTFFYWDLRVRREGLDIEAHAETIGYALAPDPFGQMASERVVSLQRQGRTLPAARR